MAQDLCTRAFRTIKAAVILHIRRKQEPKSIFVQSGFICDATAGIMFADVNHRCEQIMPNIQLYEASHPPSENASADVQQSEASQTRRNL